jgi:hypothetical protein
VLRTITRLTLAAGLALCLGLAFVPVSCGGSRGFEASSHGGDGPTIPDATVAELRACAEKSKGRLKETTYAFQFAVEVTEDGHAGRVRLKDSSPSDGEMESCMPDVLKDMPVPPAAVQALTPPAEAEAVLPESRGLVGNPLLAAAAVVELIPIALVAASVTVIVGVTIYASNEAVKKVRRKRRINAKCLEMFVVCQELGPPCTTGFPGCSDWGITPCRACQIKCLAEFDYTPACQCYSCGYR